jgi:hypothetical protein
VKYRISGQKSSSVSTQNNFNGQMPAQFETVSQKTLQDETEPFFSSPIKQVLAP